jgi:hypothetical protein
MTSSGSRPAQPPQNNMEVETLRLSCYLDFLPQPAIILSFSGPAITAESLEVRYVNDVVWETIGEQQHPDPEDLVHGSQHVAPPSSRDFKDVLHAQLINPSTAHFIQWLNEVTQLSKTSTLLKARFKGYTAPKDTFVTDRAPQFVDIEWNAVFMEKRFIILTGRRTGTLQFASSTSPEPTSDPITALPSPIDEEEEETDDSKPSIHKSAPSSSSSDSAGPVRVRRKLPKRAISSTTSTSDRSRRSALRWAEEDKPTEVDPWKNDSKVQCCLTFAKASW